MAAHVGDGERRSAPLTDLLGSLVTDVTLLARHEGELAIIELKGKASEAGIGVGLLACGALAAVFALATAIAAAVLGLAIVLPAWAAALIVAVALLAGAAALGILGRAEYDCGLGGHFGQGHQVLIEVSLFRRRPEQAVARVQRDDTKIVFARSGPAVC